MAMKIYTLIASTVLFTLSTLSLANAQWVIDDSGCRTPDRGVGNCVIIRECTTIQNLLNGVESVTPDIISIIGKYRCGIQGKNVKVCCPETPITINVTNRVTEVPPVPPVPIDPTLPKPPDVSNHKNIALLPTLTDCGPYPSRNRIINGNKTSLYDFPWMALLSYQTKNGIDFLCGGTLINNRYVLTAAHCIKTANNLVLLGIRLGEYNISSIQDCEMEGKSTLVCAEPVQDIYIEEMIPHPDYNVDNFSNDIGLLRLRTPAEFKESVQPICLPAHERLRSKNFSDARVLVTGWGSTGSESTRTDDLLQVQISVIPEEECKIAYNNSAATINYRQMCAGGQNRGDSCGGDSGGPLQLLEPIEDDINFIQYGIVSFGPRYCGQKGLPGVYTKIAYYMDWILDNMRP